MSTELDLSIVIPCRDAATVLAEQLEALTREPHGSWEVLVVDNGSTDSTVEIARRFANKLPGFRVVDASDRPGRHHACNVGAAQATGRSLIFLDADDRIAPGFVAAMSAALQQHATAVPRFDYAAFGADASLHFAYQTDGVPDTDFLPAASGSGFGIHRDVFDGVGGFDETMTYCEDMDLSWRVVLAGVALVFVPDAVVRKRQRSDLRAMFRQHFQFGVAMARLFRKYHAVGMPRRPFAEVWRDWRMIVVGLPRLRTADARVRWTRRTGRALGRLWGSVVNRTLYV